MFSKAFWQAAAERAIKSFAQSLVALFGAQQLGLLDVDWKTSLSTAGMATLLSVLTSVGSAGIGGNGPSLGAETLAPDAGPVVEDDPGLEDLAEH